MTELGREILRTPMGDNDAGAEKIGEYLTALLKKVIQEEEGFNGKRPFGNSGWLHELEGALVLNKFVEGRVDVTDLGGDDEQYEIECYDSGEAMKLIEEAIDSML